MAVEIDSVPDDRLPGTAAERVPEPANKLTMRGADALRVQAADLPATLTPLVANLPYHVAVPVCCTCSRS